MTCKGTLERHDHPCGWACLITELHGKGRICCSILDATGPLLSDLENQCGMIFLVPVLASAGGEPVGHVKWGYSSACPVLTARGPLQATELLGTHTSANGVCSRHRCSACESSNALQGLWNVDVDIYSPTEWGLATGSLTGSQGKSSRVFSGNIGFLRAIDGRAGRHGGTHKPD